MGNFRLWSQQQVQIYLSALLAKQGGKDWDSSVPAKPLVLWRREHSPQFPFPATAFFTSMLLTWLVLVPVCVAH